MSYSAARWEAAMASNYTTPPIQLQRGQGARLWDTDGKEYLDLLAGIAVNILGHAHPAIVRAVTTQIGLLSHTSNLYANGPSLRLAERLQARTDAACGTPYKTIFQNSGTEANEAALKLVRRHAHAEGMPEGVVVTFENSFHGRTYGGMTLTGQTHYQERYAPLVGQVVHVPFNDPVALERVFAEKRVAGVFFESIQGEGGVLPLHPDAAATLKRLCAANKAMLVADEIQTGVGRTGKFFGFEHDGLVPDAITLAKGLGGGLPIGAILIHPRKATLFEPGSHGTTFGGNAVAAAAGNAVLDILEQESLIGRAAALGERFMEEVREQGCSIGLPARGRGLLMGVPLSGPNAPAVVTALRSRGILVGQAGKSVLRVAPPLIVKEDELLGAIPAIVDEIAKRQPTPTKA
ncbi:MAG: acetylornithine transaminase [Candidatus Thermoplasmatota archaeon]